MIHRAKVTPDPKVTCIIATLRKRLAVAEFAAAGEKCVFFKAENGAKRLAHVEQDYGRGHSWAALPSRPFFSRGMPDFRA